jgi:CheY-like chemotaxis protein
VIQFSIGSKIPLLFLSMGLGDLMNTLAFEQQPNGLSVLVVEDESMVFFLIEDLLKELGCTTISRAADVAGALSLLREHRPDAAILDVNLAGELAYPVADRLDELGVPIVFSTGYEQAGVPEIWRSRPTISKPCTPDDLKSALATALGAHPSGY